MAKHTVTKFEITPFQEQTGLLGRKTMADEMLRMDVPGGSVYLRRSTLESAGGDWARLKQHIAQLSRTHGVPLSDHSAER